MRRHRPCLPGGVLETKGFLVSKSLTALVVVIGALFAMTASAQAQQTAYCLPGAPNNPQYCLPPPSCAKLPAKLQIARATFSASKRTIDILALITSKASGSVRISLQAASRTTTFNAPIDSARGRIKTVHSIPSSQANMGTGIITIVYNGDADTRPQTLRSRAANNKANLDAKRPTISADGILRSEGTLTRNARGVVRVELQYVNSIGGATVTLQFNAPISNGRWSLATQLSPAVRAQLATRCGTVHSYTAFTGYLPENIRGESKSYQVLPPL